MKYQNQKNHSILSKKSFTSWSLLCRTLSFLISTPGHFTLFCDSDPSKPYHLWTSLYNIFAEIHTNSIGSICMGKFIEKTKVSEPLHTNFNRRLFQTSSFHYTILGFWKQSKNFILLGFFKFRKILGSPRFWRGKSHLKNHISWHISCKQIISLFDWFYPVNIQLTDDF
jgi:hypothetical protein